MKIYRSTKDFIPLNKAVSTVGFFDGVHLGHQKIMQQVLTRAKDVGGESVVITFDPHPRAYFDPSTIDSLKLITSIDEKIQILDQLGIDHLLIIPFDRAVAELSSAQFIKDIVVNQVGTHTLMLGYDHRFGKNREGSFAYLQEHQAQFGIQVVEIPRVDIDTAAVSSTRIRESLLEGQVGLGAQLLGRNYSISGKVIEGKKLGRTIGYPTANIELSAIQKLIPKGGVYAVEVVYDQVMWGGMLNIGFNPTVSTSQKKQIEVHIFDFDKEIYGDTLTVRFLHRLRDEKKFDGLASLKAQLALDAIAAKEICFNEKTI